MGQFLSSVLHSLRTLTDFRGHIVPVKCTGSQNKKIQECGKGICREEGKWTEMGGRQERARCKSNKNGFHKCTNLLMNYFN